MSTDDDIYFDDFTIGDSYSFGPYCVNEAELLAFNHKWDPLPIHIDNEAARAMGHRSITASGQYTLCVKQVFINQARWCNAVIGALGFDEVRFPHPVYVGDDLFATIQCTGTRASRTKLDRGIVTLSFKVFNQNEITVLSYLDTVMFARRPQRLVASPLT
jgi:acyl dehydratase